MFVVGEGIQRVSGVLENKDVVGAVGSAGEPPSGEYGVPAPAKPVEAREVFPSQPAGPTTVPCNWNECLGGHRWPVSILATKCPGCGADTIAVKMENCPFCNEPASRRSIRVDHIPRGGGMNARCKGQQLCGPSVDVEFECNHWEVAQREVKNFEEKQADERSKKR